MEKNCVLIKSQLFSEVEPTRFPIHKERLEEKIQQTPQGHWYSSEQSLCFGTYPTHRVTIPLKVKGIREHVVIETHWFEPYPNALVLYHSQLIYSSTSIGQVRYEALGEALNRYFEPTDFLVIQNDEVEVLVTHQWVPFETFVENYNPYQKGAKSFSSLFRIIYTLSSYEIQELVDLTYYNLNKKEGFKTETLAYWNQGLYSSCLDGDCLFWEDGQPRETYRPGHSFLVKTGILLHIRETDQVFCLIRPWDYNTPLRMFPKKLSDLKKGLLLNSTHQKPLMWRELALLSNLPKNQIEIGQLETDGYHLFLKSPKLLEENQQTYQVGDYVQIEGKGFGMIKDVSKAGSGTYSVLTEDDFDCLRTTPYHVSVLEAVQPPTQTHQERLVLIEGQFLGRLKQEGYEYHLVEILGYRTKEEQRRCGWEKAIAHCSNVVFIESDEWLKSFQYFQLETDWQPYFQELAQSLEWDFLYQWLTYCHLFNFSKHRTSYQEIEATFFYVLTTLTRSIKHLPTIHSLLLQATIGMSSPGVSTVTGLTLPKDKARQFLRLVMESPTYQQVFTPYVPQLPTQN